MSSPETVREPHAPGLDWRVFPELELSDAAETLLARAVASERVSTTTTPRTVDVTPVSPTERAGDARAVLVQLVESGLCDLIDRMDAALAGIDNQPTVQLSRLVEVTCLYVLHRRDLIVLERQLSCSESDHHLRIAELQRAVELRFATVVEYGITTREFGVAAPMEVTRSIIDMVYALNLWHGAGLALGNAEIATHHVAMSCAMVGTVNAAATGRLPIDPAPEPTSDLALRKAFTMTVQLSPLDDVGDGPYGRRLIFRVLGGTVTGDKLAGTIKPGGADWMLLSSDGYGRIDARIEIATDDGAILYVNYPGVVDFRTLNARRIGGETSYDDHYYRCTPRLETGHRRYRWVNERVFASRGRMAGENLLEYEVFVVE